MIRNSFVSTALFCLLVSPLFAQPQLTLVPGGLEGGNWVWRAEITPDLILSGESTPMALELGFRLSDAPLLGATNINPAEWDNPNPGTVIFGWEALTDVDPGPGVNLRPVGLQTNTATNEIFAAFGSVDFMTGGAKPFLKITALGPGNGGPNSSSIEWLGAYAVGQGRIAQLVAGNGVNFDIFSGRATQMVPEPASGTMLAFGAWLLSLGVTSRRSARTAAA